MHNKKGLTIAELIVAITISGIVMIALVPLIIYTYSNFNLYTKESQSVYTMSSALRDIKIDADRNYEFLSQPLSANSTTPAPSGGWKFTGSGTTSRTLILKLPATTDSYQNKNRKLVYNSSAGDCSSNSRVPLFYTAVFYLHQGTLYKRTILDSSQVPCSGQAIHQKNTCHHSSSGCQNKDMTLETNVSSFTVDYYSSRSSTSATSYTTLGSTGLGDVTDAKVTITTQRPGSSGASSSYTNSIRVSISPLVETD